MADQGDYDPKAAHGLRRFEPGNQVGKRHGAYAVLDLAPRAAEVAEAVRAQMGTLYDPRFEIAIGVLAGDVAAYERAIAALADAEADGLRWLREDARAWSRAVMRGLAELGLTPSSAAKLGLTLVQTGDELQRYLAQRERANSATSIDVADDDTEEGSKRCVSTRRSAI